MSRPLVIVRSSPGLIWTRVTVEAERDAAATFGSLIGSRRFHLEEGRRLTLRLKGRDWQRGDRLHMTELVSAALDWASIPWGWGYDY